MSMQHHRTTPQSEVKKVQHLRHLLQGITDSRECEEMASLFVTSSTCWRKFWIFGYWMLNLYETVFTFCIDIYCLTEIQNSSEALNIDLESSISHYINLVSTISAAELFVSAAAGITQLSATWLITFWWVKPTSEQPAASTPTIGLDELMKGRQLPMLACSPDHQNSVSMAGNCQVNVI